MRKRDIAAYIFAGTGLLGLMIKDGPSTINALRNHFCPTPTQFEATFLGHKDEIDEIERIGFDNEQFSQPTENTVPREMVPDVAEPPQQELPIYTHPTLGDFSAPRFQQYDDFIIARCAEWNDHFRTLIPNYQNLEPNLIKRMMLAESGGTPSAWEHDPGQVANDGDTALDDLRGNRIRLLFGQRAPLVALFEDVTHTPRVNGRWDYTNSGMTGETSIELMIPYLIAKKAATYAIERDNEGNYVSWFCSGHRDWIDAAARYNGGGDGRYRQKLESFVEQ